MKKLIVVVLLVGAGMAAGAFLMDRFGGSTAEHAADLPATKTEQVVAVSPEHAKTDGRPIFGTPKPVLSQRTKGAIQ